ncbi:MAG: glycosyl hydrolase [Bacteroidota bacterium]
MKKILILMALWGMFGSLTAKDEGDPVPKTQAQTVDQQATRQTKALWMNLKQLGKSQILFGHEDDLAYGINWRAERGRSDVKEVCGSYPAVFGWDVSKLGKHPHNIDSVNFRDMRKWMKQAYKMGAINTISWHLDNPVSKGDSWDTTPAVRQILPGGSHHAAFLEKLDLFADFVKKLKVGVFRRQAVPIIFRPFHEHSGSWFWWGEDFRTDEEYIQLWRFTVHYLRDEKGLHNLLYAYSPDIVSSKEEYLKCYPGDEYVDILGMDNYQDFRSSGNPADFPARTRMLVELAEEKGKPSALTETGSEGIPNPEWWTGVLLEQLKKDPLASGISYLLVWRNGWVPHHFGPYPDHHSAEDFRKFFDDPMIWFADHLPDLYRYPATY